MLRLPERGSGTTIQAPVRPSGWRRNARQPHYPTGCLYGSCCKRYRVCAAACVVLGRGLTAAISVMRQPCPGMAAVSARRSARKVNAGSSRSLMAQPTPRRQYRSSMTHRDNPARHGRDSGDIAHPGRSGTRYRELVRKAIRCYRVAVTRRGGENVAGACCEAHSHAANGRPDDDPPSGLEPPVHGAFEDSPKYHRRPCVPP